MPDNTKFKHIYIETTENPLVYNIHEQVNQILIGKIHMSGGEFQFYTKAILFHQDALAEILASLEVANNRVSIRPTPTEGDNGYEF